MEALHDLAVVAERRTEKAVTGRIIANVERGRSVAAPAAVAARAALGGTEPPGIRIRRGPIQKAPPAIELLLIGDPLEALHRRRRNAVRFPQIVTRPLIGIGAAGLGAAVIVQQLPEMLGRLVALPKARQLDRRESAVGAHELAERRRHLPAVRREVRKREHGRVNVFLQCGVLEPGFDCYILQVEVRRLLRMLRADEFRDATA